MNLARQDYYAPGNGGLPLQVARQYNNRSDAYANNAGGWTLLGPKWHFSYDMHIKVVPDGTNTFIRRSDGGQTVMYYLSTGKWISYAPAGESVELERRLNDYKLSTTDPNFWYTFSLTTGKLLSIRSHNGNTVTFSYDGDNRLTRADFGHETNDIDTRYITFEHTSITYNGKTRNRLQRVRVYPSGDVVAEYTYATDSGCLERVWNRFGEAVAYYTYAPAILDTDEFLLKEVHGRDGDGNLQLHRSYEYNSFRDLVKMKDGAGSTIFTNTVPEGQRYLNTTTLPNDLKYSYVLDHSRNTTETEVLDSNNNRLRKDYQEFIMDPYWLNQSNMMKTSYSDSGSTVTYDYIDEAIGGTAGDRKYIKKITFADGTATQYGYDANYNVNRITKPLGRITEFGYSASGNLEWSRDALGNTSYNTYDAWGRLIKTEDPTSGTTHFAYNAGGNVTVTTDTQGRATVRSYNSTRPHLVDSVTALGVTTTYEYDSRDRLTTTTDHLGNKTVSSYDARGKVLTSEDPMGNLTRYAYNTTGSLQNVIDANDGWTTYTYDDNSRLVKFTDQRGKHTEYGYDLQGRKIWEKNPLGLITSYGYHDHAGCSGCGTSAGGGELAWVTQPTLVDTTTSYTYDIMGRLKKKTYSDSSDEVEFFYDTAGRIIRVYDNRLGIGDNSFHYSYDANDRVTSETYPDNATIRYTFDPLGRRTLMVDPDGNETGYTYANTGTNKKLQFIDHPFGGTIEYGYDNDILPASEYFHQNGGSNTWQHDTLNRVFEVVNRGYKDDAINREIYTYNANSMRTRVDYSDDLAFLVPHHRLFSYDNLLRLTEEHKRWDSDNTTAWRRVYTYDAAGNRLTMENNNGVNTDTTAYTYNDFNQLIENSDHDFSYDNNGNLIGRGGEGQVYYDHNRENRLTGYRAGVNTTSYTYDYLGRRIQRTAPNGDKTRYYYDGINVLLTREQPSVGIIWRTKNVYALKQASIGHIISERTHTAWLLTVPTTWTDRWYHYDLLGNVTLQTDDTGAVAAQPEMEAFGNVLSGSQAGYHLTTKEYDDDSGLYYFNARWYDPECGHWLQTEPTDADWPSIYSFTLNRPTAAYDPDGLSTNDYWPLPAVFAREQIPTSPRDGDTGNPGILRPPPIKLPRPPRTTPGTKPTSPTQPSKTPTPAPSPSPSPSPALCPEDGSTTTGNR